MIAKRIGALLLFAAGVVAANAASAQDFHVETTVHDLSHTPSRELMRSVTLFHAGRTYDFIHELGELIVFDPAHDQFILLNTRQHRSAVAHVDEINRMLQIARGALEDHLKTLKPGEEAQAEQILFQFNPQFSQQFKQTNAGPQLDLKSKYFEYQVLCAAPPTPQLGQTYLQYADWISRLNYVLSPGRILPEQRIVLNSILRKSNLIPVEVVFVGDVGGRTRYRAQHRMYWDLNDKDRELIRQWDLDLARKDLKRVNIQEYQRALLMSQTSRHH
jgi:hypothetical protein